MAVEGAEKVYRRVEVDQLTKNNLKQFRIIVEKAGKRAALDPEKAGSTAVEQEEDSYDADSIQISDEIAKKWVGEECSKLGYFNDICVGGIAWKQVGEVVYIQILAVLPAYRNLGVGKALVTDFIESRRAFKPSLLETKPTSLAVHATPGSVAFFETLGFTKKGDICDAPTSTAATTLISSKGYTMSLAL